MGDIIHGVNDEAHKVDGDSTPEKKENGYLSVCANSKDRNRAAGERGWFVVGKLDTEFVHSLRRSRSRVDKLVI